MITDQVKESFIGKMALSMRDNSSKIRNMVKEYSINKMEMCIQDALLMIRSTVLELINKKGSPILVSGNTTNVTEREN